MIQRIQTLFLAGVVLLSGLLFSLPMYSIVTAGDSLRQVFMIRENIFLTALNGLVLIGALAALFLYKNRRLQVRVCSLLMLLVSILIVTVFYFSDTAGTTDATLSFEFGAYLVLVNLVLLWLAIRFIRKDDSLVRSADRLR